MEMTPQLPVRLAQHQAAPSSPGDHGEVPRGWFGSPKTTLGSAGGGWSHKMMEIDVLGCTLSPDEEKPSEGGWMEKLLSRRGGQILLVEIPISQILPSPFLPPPTAHGGDTKEHLSSPGLARGPSPLLFPPMQPPNEARSWKPDLALLPSQPVPCPWCITKIIISLDAIASALLISNIAQQDFFGPLL